MSGHLHATLKLAHWQKQRYVSSCRAYSVIKGNENVSFYTLKLVNLHTAFGCTIHTEKY